MPCKRIGNHLIDNWEDTCTVAPFGSANVTVSLQASFMSLPTLLGNLHSVDIVKSCWREERDDESVLFMCMGYATVTGYIQ